MHISFSRICYYKNSLFLDNSAANSGGVVGVAYFAVRLIGRNTFQYNAGTSITVSERGRVR